MAQGSWAELHRRPASRVQGPRQLRLWENETGSHKLLPWIAGLGVLVAVLPVVLGLVMG